MDNFSSVDMSDLQVVLKNNECREKVTASSLVGIVGEIPHKELIQKPMSGANLML